jgi:hypothetical protein
MLTMAIQLIEMHGHAYADHTCMMNDYVARLSLGGGNLAIFVGVSSCSEMNTVKAIDNDTFGCHHDQNPMHRRGPLHFQRSYIRINKPATFKERNLIQY